MGLFNRRGPAQTGPAAVEARDEGLPPPTTAGAPTRRRGLFGGRSRASKSTDAGYGAGGNHGRGGFFHGHGGRPVTFGGWFKGTALDILTMFIMGAIGLGVYFAHPAPTRSFPILFADGQVVYPEFAYPLRKEIVPIWAAAVLAFFVPFVVFLICQIRVRSFWDLNNAVIGLLYSLICAAVFQVFLKWLIGGLRPHFLDVCDPDPAAIQGAGIGFQRIMFDRSVCRGDEKKINDSLESFPSGHTTAAFGGFVFLYLYLNAKLKVFANYHPAMWKLVVTYAPLLGAVLIGGALTIDEFHNWYDILAGAIIGTMFAFSSYRMVYASVWDFRFNHIPLSREIGFTYSEGQAEFETFRHSFWTRRAGWDGAAAMGAPFDATGGFSGGIGGGSGGYGGGAASHSISRRPVAGYNASPEVGTGHGGIRNVEHDVV